MDRRTFALSGTVTLLGLSAKGLAQQTSAPTTPTPVTPSAGNSQAPPRPPALAQEMVKEFVIAAHGNLEKTKVMLAAEPGLVNATWDWGGGDFEQAIGGAGHMDIFVAAMLGDLDLVKAWLQAQPHQATARGPHGIPLLVHAQMGAKNGVKEASGVVEFLQSMAASQKA